MAGDRFDRDRDVFDLGRAQPAGAPVQKRVEAGSVDEDAVVVFDEALGEVRPEDDYRLDPGAVGATPVELVLRASRSRAGGPRATAA